MSIRQIVYPEPSPKNYFYQYVSITNPHMLSALRYAKTASLDFQMPTATVIVDSRDQEISIAANGSDYHKTHPCQRTILNIPTGQGYELCEGCHPKNHSESRAIKSALSRNLNLSGYSLYLWGHWWCCKNCW